MSPSLRLGLPAAALFACSAETGERPGPVQIDAGPTDAGAVDAPYEIDGGDQPDAAPPVDAVAPPVDAVAPPIDAEPPPPDADPCPSPRVESWTGTASRDNTIGYPDHIAAAITWQRTGTVGCVDEYAPVGTATYGYAIPGALCQQWITPESHDVVGGDGTLTIDRTSVPAAYSGGGATYWAVRWHCQYDDGSEDYIDFVGGAAWFDAAGTVAGGVISGSREEESGSDACGPEGIPPCIYTWSFLAD